MINLRLIAVVPIIDNKVVLSRKFKQYSYIGSPEIVISYLNQWEVDEIVLLDIKNSNLLSDNLINKLNGLSSLSQTPLAVGGGIRNIDQISKIINSGVEKVILNSFIYENYSLIENAAKKFGSQAISCCIDFYKHQNKYFLFSNSVNKKRKVDVINHINHIQQNGAGELIFNSICRDGCSEGYDFQFYKKYKKNINLPFIYVGGYNSTKDIIKGIKHGVNSYGIGNFFNFVEHSPVLIREELLKNINNYNVKPTLKINYKDNYLRKV